MKSFFLLIALVTILHALARGENWPAWRGADGIGVSSEKELPTHWSVTENIRWKTPLPDRGNSTPVIWGNRIFITQRLEKQRALLCLDRENGKLLWQQGLAYNEPEESHEANPYCSASPVTDGERVIVWFGSAGVVSYNF